MRVFSTLVCGLTLGIASTGSFANTYTVVTEVTRSGGYLELADGTQTPLARGLLVPDGAKVVMRNGTATLKTAEDLTNIEARTIDFRSVTVKDYTTYQEVATGSIVTHVGYISDSVSFFTGVGIFFQSTFDKLKKLKRDETLFCPGPAGGFGIKGSAVEVSCHASDSNEARATVYEGEVASFQLAELAEAHPNYFSDPAHPSFENLMTEVYIAELADTDFAERLLPGSVIGTAGDVIDFDRNPDTGEIYAVVSPEPGTWATLLFGLVAIAGAQWRRTRSGRGTV